jgi:ethanolamine ammonia-lyase large subunit
MAACLSRLGVLADDDRPQPGSDVLVGLYDRYAKSADGHVKLARLQERGFDLGYGWGKDQSPPDNVTQRLQTIYSHARASLYASVDASVVREACFKPMVVRTASLDREDYLNHPSTGERLRDDDARVLAGLGGDAPEVQIVVSDGLNANAVNRNLKAFLPALRRALAGLACPVSATEIVVHNGRVRAGYQIGAIVKAMVVVHVIGERPGTGLDTLSAYVTYGRDDRGRVRWDPSLDHSCTNAVCGIHPSGKPPAAAAAEIGELTRRILAQRRSGVALRLRS